MAATTRVIKDESHLYGACFMFESEGSDEAAVTKVDVSTLSPACAWMDILLVQWVVFNMTHLEIYFDADTDDLALRLPAGSGILDMSLNPGGSNFVDWPGIQNPKTTGYTGDIKFTTVGGTTSGESMYTVILWGSKRN